MGSSLGHKHREPPAGPAETRVASAQLGPSDEGLNRARGRPTSLPPAKRAPSSCGGRFDRAADSHLKASEGARQRPGNGRFDGPFAAIVLAVAPSLPVLEGGSLAGRAGRGSG